MAVVAAAKLLGRGHGQRSAVSASSDRLVGRAADAVGAEEFAAHVIPHAEYEQRIVVKPFAPAVIARPTSHREREDALSHATCGTKQDVPTYENGPPGRNPRGPPQPNPHPPCGSGAGPAPIAPVGPVRSERMTGRPRGGATSSSLSRMIGSPRSSALISSPDSVSYSSSALASVCRSSICSVRILRAHLSASSTMRSDLLVDHFARSRPRRSCCCVDRMAEEDLFLVLVVAQRPELVAHAPFGDHPARRSPSPA